MNWGHGITIAIVAFMVFITTLVLIVNSKNFELFSDSYYEDELVFDARYSALEKGAQYADQCAQKSVGESYFVTVPSELVENIDDANLLFRHPQTASKDRTYQWTKGQPEIQVSLSDFDSGTIYQMELAMEINDENYLIEKDVRIP